MLIYIIIIIIIIIIIMRHDSTPLVFHRASGLSKEYDTFFAVPSERSDVYDEVVRSAGCLVGPTGCARLGITPRKGSRNNRVVIKALNMTCKLIIRGGDDNKHMLSIPSVSPVLWLTRVNKDALGHIISDDGDAAGDISRQVQDLKKLLPMYLIDQSPGSVINRVCPDDVKLVHRSVRGSEWWGDVTSKDPLNLPFLAGALVDCISTCRSVCHQPYVLVLRLQQTVPLPRTPPRTVSPRAKKGKAAKTHATKVDGAAPEAAVEMPAPEVAVEIEMPAPEAADEIRLDEAQEEDEEQEEQETWQAAEGGFDAAAAKAFHDERCRQFWEDREQGGRGAMVLSGDKFV